MLGTILHENTMDGKGASNHLSWLEDKAERGCLIAKLRCKAFKFHWELMVLLHAVNSKRGLSGKNGARSLKEFMLQFTGICNLFA